MAFIAIANQGLSNTNWVRFNKKPGQLLKIGTKITNRCIQCHYKACIDILFVIPRYVICRLDLGRMLRNI